MENIHSTNGSGAYGIFINIERCSSSIMHCKFRNISDARETVDPIGVIKGMCGGVFYSGTSSALTTTPCMQVLDGAELENIYTSQPNGEINNVSTDADGIRVFVNDARTETKFYNAQSYSFSNIIGRDIQKRILKLSGVTNCKIENVTYEGNKKLPQRFPLSLIAVMDAFDVSVKSVRNISGCMKIGFVILNSKNIQLESFFLSGNGKDYNNSKAWLFRVFNSNNLRIENVKFEGNFEQLGRVYDSKDVYLQFDGHDFNTGNSLDVKRSDSVVVNCTLRNVGPGRTPLMFFDNVKDVKVNCNQKNVYSRIVDLGAYNNVDVLVNEESND